MSFTRNALYWSMADKGILVPGTASGGNFTTGTQFCLTKTKTLHGVRWVCNHTGTFKVSAWSPAAARLTFETVVIGATGIITTLFATPQVITAHANPYCISVYNTNASTYIKTTTNNNMPNLGTTPLQWGKDVMFYQFAYQAGDACPAFGITSELYTMDPIF